MDVSARRILGLHPRPLGRLPGHRGARARLHDAAAGAAHRGQLWPPAAPWRAHRSHRFGALLLQVVSGPPLHTGARDQHGLARLGDDAPRGAQGVRGGRAHVYAGPCSSALRAPPGDSPRGAPPVARALRAAARAAGAHTARLQGGRAESTQRHQGNRAPAPRRHLSGRPRHARRHALHAPPGGAAVRAAAVHARRPARGRDASHGGRGRQHGGDKRVGGCGDPAAPRKRAALAQEGRVARKPAPTARGRDAQLLVVVVGWPLGPLEPCGAPGGPGGQRAPLGVLPVHLDPLLVARKPPRLPRLAPRLGAVRRAAQSISGAPHVHVAARRAVSKGRARRFGQRGRVAPRRAGGVRAPGHRPQPQRRPRRAMLCLDSHGAGRRGRSDEPARGRRGAAGGVCAHRCAPVGTALLRPRCADAAQAVARHLSAAVASARTRRGPVRGGAHAASAARHRALLLLRVPARRQLGAGQHWEGHGLQRARAVGEHAHGRLRHVLQPHAVCQARDRRAAHGSRA